MFRKLIFTAAALGFASLVSAQEVPQAITDALKSADAGIAKIAAVPTAQRTFDNTLGSLDEVNVRLENATNMILFMQYVSPDPKIREGSRAAEQAVTEYGIELSKREDLYKAIKEYADKNPSLQGEQKRYLDHTMRDYRLSGMTLPEAQRNKLKEIEKELSKLGIDFETNINEDATRIPLSLAELNGVPVEAYANQPKLGTIYLLPLDGPTYGAIMDYCSVPTTRQKIQWLYRRRGGEKNVETLEKMLKLRWQAAQILGFENTVDMMVATRMAKNSKVIAKFYSDLRPIVRKKAVADFAEFSKAKQIDLKDPKAKLMPWDYSYYKQNLLRTKYAVDSQKVSEYFPMESVVKGLFSITQTLYGVEMRDVTSKAKELGFELWHPDVKLYEFYDKPTGKLIGRMFTDLYPRPNKYSHAACWGLGSRKVWPDGSIQVPLAALVCNFPKPTPGRPALLQHDDVETFFHEFGHGLHNMFTETQYARFSGTSVARDFVEAPSQMMENWVWDPAVLRAFAKHYKTGKVLPDSILNGMKAARTLGSGIETEGQFWLGLMDQTFHTAKDGNIDTTKIASQLYDTVTMYDPVPDTFYQASFGHLVGYEGAYYGYLWSLVYAQDMFGKFEENGLMNPEAGMYYRKKILARGGSMDEMDLLRDYLGREPNMDAFMKHLGLSK